MILTDEQCKEVISWTNLYGKENVRYCEDVCGPLSGLHKSRLDYNITEVKRDSRTQWFFSLLKDYLSPQYPNNTVDEADYFYLHEFFEGALFKKHIDKNRENSWQLVVGATLNNEYEGGKLLTYNPDMELASTKGELYNMDSAVLHEVTKVTKGSRYSFVKFVEDKELNNSKNIL